MANHSSTVIVSRKLQQEMAAMMTTTAGEHALREPLLVD
jgi:hypothetical protein